MKNVALITGITGQDGSYLAVLLLELSVLSAVFQPSSYKLVLLLP